MAAFLLWFGLAFLLYGVLATLVGLGAYISNPGSGDVEYKPLLVMVYASSFLLILSSVSYKYVMS